MEEMKEKVSKSCRLKLRQRLASLWRAECIQKRGKRREKDQANFFKNPFIHHPFARQMLEEAKSGTLNVTREELEEHVRRQSSDLVRNEPLGPLGHLPRLDPLVQIRHPPAKAQ
ncbi:hypothetical protein QQF64_034693 [Cirrhinus molitorella]|uniref:Uncharacterized protein n=1 Tax=Cirrhinus molitorella TaxID=172907 RepID=A0ABR3L260_9TELE